jgi:hypothetical protein
VCSFRAPVERVIPTLKTWRIHSGQSTQVSGMTLRSPRRLWGVRTLGMNTSSLTRTTQILVPVMGPGMYGANLRRGRPAYRWNGAGLSLRSSSTVTSMVGRIRYVSLEG